MKKEWTFNYFGKAEPDKNKAHVPEKQCGLNLWNSFIRNSMLKKKLDSHKKLILVKNVTNLFSIPFFKWYIFFCYLYWSLGAVFYMFGLLRVAISSIKLCFSIKKSNIWEKDSIFESILFKQFNIEKMSMIFFELLDQLPTSTTYRKSVRHCGKAAHLLANDI